MIYKQLELRPCIGIKSWVFSAFPPLATWWWLTAVECKPLQFMRPGEWSICYRIAILSCNKTLGVEKGSHGPTPPICSLREGFMEYMYIYIYIRKRKWHFPVFFGWLNFSRQNISQDVSSKMGCVRIQACGRNSTVADVDLSLELEQLAVSGQRGVHLWQILSQAPVDWLTVSVEGNTDAETITQTVWTLMITLEVTGHLFEVVLWSLSLERGHNVSALGQVWCDWSTGGGKLGIVDAHWWVVFSRLEPERNNAAVLHTNSQTDGTT